MKAPALSAVSSLSIDEVLPARRNLFLTYRTRLEAEKAELAQIDGAGAALANGRTIAFLSASGFALATIFGKLPSWGFGAAALSSVLYVALATWHSRLLRREARTKARLSLNERGLLRMAERWHDFPSLGAEHLEAMHPYASDLDVFGQGSLFQKLDETRTRWGERQLAKALLAPSSLEEAKSKQKAIQTLAERLDFRHALLSELTLAAEGKSDPEPMIQWAQSDDLLQSIRWARWLPFLLPPLTLGLYVFAPSTFVWAGLLAQVVVLFLTYKTMARYYERLSKGESRLARYAQAFKVLETQSFSDGLLQELRAKLNVDGEPISKRLRQFERLFALVEVRQSGQMHGLLNWWFLWDLIWMFRLESWRAREKHQVKQWFQILAHFESLCAMAGFAAEHPDYAFPTFQTGEPHFVASQLGHPLLAKPVCNDVSFPNGASGWIITGSNMSGKTTLLRAMGLNTVMALAGLPTCAHALSLSRLQVATSMRVKDSLERGVSYFYAEVQRMKLLVEQAQTEPTFFLLDEILMGTNTQERQLASRKLLELLLKTGAIGAVATHDLSLTEWQATSFSIKNVHFRDLLQDGKMVFDYRLQEGVVQTTNALRVIRDAGIPI